jgi:hypothetical protein
MEAKKALIVDNSVDNFYGQAAQPSFPSGFPISENSIG